MDRQDRPAGQTHAVRKPGGFAAPGLLRCGSAGDGFGHRKSARRSRNQRRRYSQRGVRRLLARAGAPARNVNLTNELDRFLAKKIKAGRYENASEVVRAGLRSLEREERGYEA